MIFARLTQRWQALRYWREHQSLSRLELVRRLADAPGGVLASPLHQLGQRDYLMRGMDARDRLRCVLAHYRFEDATFNATFNAAYHDAVYDGPGIALWRHESQDGDFALTLGANAQDENDGEGDLTIALTVDGVLLHRLSWTWVEGALFGIDLAATPTLPLVTRNQGRWNESGAAFEAFENVFPNNSPSFFCFAALQGMAQLLGVDRVLAVRATSHLAYAPRQDEAQARAFENSYDGFWRILGGAELDARSYLIPLPFYLKPLQDMPSKHRKRAAQRREYWRAIGEATRATLLRIHAPVERAWVQRASEPSTEQV